MKTLLFTAYLLAIAGASTPTPSKVYVTEKGTKYHTHKECRYLKGKSPKTVTIKEAESQQKTICKTCQVKDVLNK